ncbi:MAG: aldo/keto reductase [Litorimonas sp.]
MTRIELSSGLTLSRLIYGMWRLGDDSDTSPSHIEAKIDACLAQGITTFDQADIYGGYEAEALLGNCLKSAPHLKDKMEIITKCGIVAPVGRHKHARVKYYDTSTAHITASVEASLTLMNIEQIDLLLIHRPDPFMDHRDTGACLDGLIQSGKIKAAGVSNFKPYDMALLSSVMSNPLVTNQIEISLSANNALTNGDIAYLQENNIAPMAWSPLGGGALFSVKNQPLTTRIKEIASAHNVDEAAVCVAWLLAHPANIMPVFGTNTLARIQAISKAFNVHMDRQTWFELYTLARGAEVA